jgi:hypothetical protein
MVWEGIVEKKRLEFFCLNSWNKFIVLNNNLIIVKHEVKKKKNKSKSKLYYLLETKKKQNNLTNKTNWIIFFLQILTLLELHIISN